MLKPDLPRTIVREDHDEAERLYRKALKLEPHSELAKTHYERFLQHHPEFVK